MTDLSSNSHQGEFFIYQTNDGGIQVECRFEQDNLWLSLNQISSLFGRDKSVISKHLKNIYDEGELVQDSTVAKYATVQIEGSREVNRQLEYDKYRRIIDLKPNQVDQDLTDAIKKLDKK